MPLTFFKKFYLNHAFICHVCQLSVRGRVPVVRLFFLNQREVIRTVAVAFEARGREKKTSSYTNTL